MTWIAFDEKTRSALSEVLDAPVRLVTDSIDPLEYALASERSSVLLVPFGSSEHMVVLTVKKNVREEPASPPAPALAAKHEATTPKHEATRTSHYVTSGFLGLNDEVELEEEPKKSWWKRLFE